MAQLKGYPCLMHMHTSFSFDGESTLRQQLDAAARCGIAVVAVTDHCEMNAPQDVRHEPDVLAGLAQLETLRADYPEMTLLRGVELGQATQNVEAAREFVSSTNLDFILGSTHNIRNHEDFYDIDYSGCNYSELYAMYLEEELEMIELDLFDSLAHLTYPLRYIREKCHLPLDEAVFAPKYDEILRQLALRGKALEVNTSAIRNGGELCPDIALLRRFKELGGELVTVGSDAHRCDNICSGLAEGFEAVREAGFGSVAIFRNRCAEQIAIV